MEASDPASADPGARVSSEVTRRQRVNRQSPIPLHLQIRQILLDSIESGELRPGARLLQEREIAARYDLSLAPVRQAILDLVKEGYLYRERGRGTFVREPKVEEKISILSSFTESLRAKGLRADVRVLKQELVSAPKDVHAALLAREQSLLLIERLALVDHEPVALLAAYLSPTSFPGLNEVSLENASLYRTLEERFGTTVVRAENVIEVMRCNPAEAALLDVPRGTPALQVEGRTFDQQDRPVEYSRVVYRADRFRFRLDSFRRSDQVVHVMDGLDEARRY
jgi:GntR family transcriptional regulator